eukprot:GSMAST32.ASY1.ANO1.9.1 assembled CDS
MTETLVPDSFLDDLDDLDDVEDSNDIIQSGKNGVEGDINPSENDIKLLNGKDSTHSNANRGVGSNSLKIPSPVKFQNVAKLRSTLRYKNHMSAIRASLECPTKPSITEADSDYDLVMSSNELLHEMSTEISNVRVILSKLYLKKFPELDNLVKDSVVYASVIKCIGKEKDITAIDLGNILPNALCMVVTVTASTTVGTDLTENEIAEALFAADELLGISSDRKIIVDFIESRMCALAPNTSALVGTTIAARLVSHTGGLLALARIPSCNIQVVGKKVKAAMGFGVAATQPNVGIIFDASLVQSAPSFLQIRALRAVSAKTALCVRADCAGSRSRGDMGRRFKRELEAKILKWQEPPKGKALQALKVPGSRPPRKRGGRAQRARKEKFAMTEVRKAQNKISFGDFRDEYGDNAMGLSKGVLGKGGIVGQLRAQREKKQKWIDKKKQKGKGKKMNAGSSGVTSGLASSLVFTPVQGMELVNPELQKKKLEVLSNSYFSEDASFQKVNHVNKKRKIN